MEIEVEIFNKISMDNYEEIKKKLLDENTTVEFKAELINILKQHSSKSIPPPISELIETNLVRVLIDLRLQFPLDEKIILNILWIITNVLTGDKSQLDHVINEKGIEYILEYIPNDNKEIVHQAVWGLANIAGECASYRDMVLGLNRLGVILDYFKEETSIDILKTLAWFISNLARGQPVVDYELIRPCISYLVHLQKFCGLNEELMIDYLWAISYMTETSATFIEDLMQTNILQHLVHHQISFIENNFQILTPFLRILANLVSGDEESTSFVISLGISDRFIIYLSSTNVAIRKETAFLISNIAAGTQTQRIIIVNQPNLLYKIKERLQNDEITVKRECAWIIGNLLTSKCPVIGENISKVSGLMETLLAKFNDFLESPVQMIKAILEAYFLYLRFLKESGASENNTFTTNLKEFVDQIRNNIISLPTSQFNFVVSDIEAIENELEDLEIPDEDREKIEKPDSELDEKVESLKIED